MNARLPTLNLIGAGRVGQTLARLWTQAGVFAVQDVLTTSRASAQAACDFIGAGTPAQSRDTMRRADVWLIATVDAQIASSAAALAVQASHARAAYTESGLVPSETSTTADPGAQGLRRPRTAFHCSGALSASVLAPLGALGWQVASAHPILSFANAQAACAQFAGTPCALEGDAAARTLLQAARVMVEMAMARDLSLAFKMASPWRLDDGGAQGAATLRLSLQDLGQSAPWRTQHPPPPHRIQPFLRRQLLKP